jgi:putative spermidine/putrescine transport system substrate-binding protein
MKRICAAILVCLVFGAAYGNGGSVEDPMPGVEYLAKLHHAGNIQRVEGATPYAKFIKGEIPVWIAYEGDGLKAKITDGMGDDCAVVISRADAWFFHAILTFSSNFPNVGVRI